MDQLENTTHTVKNINTSVFFLFFLTPWKVEIHDSHKTATLQTQYIMNSLIDDDDDA